jgi:hypothetical protein
MLACKVSKEMRAVEWGDGYLILIGKYVIVCLIIIDY